jgi:putative hemolysin
MKNRIEPLIAERAPWLANGRNPLIRAAMDRLLGLSQTLDLAEVCATLPSDRILSIMSSLIACTVKSQGRENIPRKGAALIVANHPTGIADGIILHHLFAPIRPDLFFYANSDILRVLPQLSDRIAPVEWRPEKRSHTKSRATLDFTRQAVAAGRVGVLFPSGRLAQRRGLRLHERPWMASAAMIARKYDLPVIPVNIRARNSALFYLLDLIHPTLRDITLFHEVLNKEYQPYSVTVGRPIPPAHLPQSNEATIAMLREATLSLGAPQSASLSLWETSRTPSWLEALAPLH